MAKVKLLCMDCGGLLKEIPEHHYCETCDKVAHESEDTKCIRMTAIEDKELILG